jgi:hypothetical protein
MSITEDKENPIKVYEEFKPEKQTFTKEEFINYLKDHKDDLKNVTTYKMNRRFTIKGYRINRIRGELCLVVNRYISKENKPIGKDLKILDEKINYVILVLKDHDLIPDEEVDEEY